MEVNMEVSENIVKIIQMFEGYTPVAKHLKGDRKHIITGGYGTIIHPSGQPVKVGDKFSREYSLYCLMFEVKKKCKKLNKVIEENSIILNQNQFDALACFIYNIGEGKLNPGTTMGDAIRSDNIQSMADAFLVYVKGTEYILGVPYKKTLPGLVSRRKAERELFLS